MSCRGACKLCRDRVYSCLLGGALDKVAQRWTEEEFAGLALGDARLNKRARTLMDTFAAKPTASIPEACDSWSETCAAYRFLSNPEVTWEGILTPHWARTQERMRAQEIAGRKAGAILKASI